MASLPLKFQPLSSAIDIGFLHELGRRKLHDFGLSDEPVDIQGSLARAERREVASPLCLGAEAFAADTSGVPPSLCIAPGTLINANTLEDFKEWDKAKLIESTARRVWDDIENGKALAEPERLLRFLLLTFADLKSHKYFYWFAFPAFAINPPPVASSPTALSDVVSATQLVALREGYAALTAAAPSGLFHAPAFFVVWLASDGTLQVGPLAQYAEWREAEGRGEGEAMLAFADTSALPTNPGWTLRNLLVLAARVASRGAKGGGTVSVRVVCFREPPLGASTSLTNAAVAGLNEAGHGVPSIVLNVTMAGLDGTQAASAAPSGEASSGAVLPGNVVGWERNTVGKLGARMMDLSAQMRPEALAEASVDLNLRLMRWRLMPSLQTEKVAATRCLLMGAGTLGCSVARCLLGWGVRHITFVDSGTVSYSNPVRQALFTFQDCVGGATPKAQAAADALSTIFPSVQSSAHRIAIPMPGHTVVPEEEARVRADCATLSCLVEAHDVVFLLTDTRESRWLPTLLAMSHGKLVLNAALGFDSLLVMRHGLPPPPEATAAADVPPPSGPPPSGSPARLGCYFCNDVVAPANSMLRRTLDQQCTVSRPGLAMVASALAVELMVTLLHHPDAARAGADMGGSFGGGGRGEGEGKSPLGYVPHQIRASLPTFRNDCMIGCAFDKCTACSPTVMDAYRTRGADFLLDAFNRVSYLEDLTGLTEMHAETEKALQDVTLFDDDDDDDM